MITFDSKRGLVLKEHGQLAICDHPSNQKFVYKFTHYLDSYIILSYFGVIYSFIHFGVIYINLLTSLPKKNTRNFDMPRTSDVAIQNTQKIEMKKVSAQYGLNILTNSQKRHPKLPVWGFF